MSTIHERYRNDPMIHRLVDVLEVQIEQLNLTPSEIRECATLAAIHYEQRRPPLPMIAPPGVMEPLR